MHKGEREEACDKQASLLELSLHIKPPGLTFRYTSVVVFGYHLPEVFFAGLQVAYCIGDVGRPVFAGIFIQQEGNDQYQDGEQPEKVPAFFPEQLIQYKEGKQGEEQKNKVA